MTQSKKQQHIKPKILSFSMWSIFPSSSNKVLNLEKDVSQSQIISNQKGKNPRTLKPKKIKTQTKFKIHSID